MLLFCIFVCLYSEAFAARYVDLTQNAPALSRNERGIGQKSLSGQLNLSDKTNLKEKDSMVTAQGTIVRKYHETYNDIPVYDTLVDVEETPDGVSHLLAGDVYVDLEADLENQFGCQLEEDEAVQIALGHARLRGATVTAKHFDTIVYVDDFGTATLSKQVDLSVIAEDGKRHRPFTWVGLCHKTVLAQYDQMGHNSVQRAAGDSSTQQSVSPSNFDVSTDLPGDSSTQQSVGPTNFDVSTDAPGDSSTQYSVGPTHFRSTDTQGDISTQQSVGPTHFDVSTDAPGDSSTQQQSVGPTNNQATTDTPGDSSTQQQSIGPTNDQATTDTPGESSTQQQSVGPTNGQTTKDTPDSTTQGRPTGATNPPITAKPSADCDVKGKAGNPKRKFQVGENGHCLELKREGGTCFLENAHIKGVDLKETENDAKTEVVKFQCSQGYSDAVNGGFAPMFEAFYFGTKTAQAYSDWYGHLPIKEALYVKAHYGKNYENAFFDGTALGFGDGNGDSTYPWTNLDTVAHEYGHGVVDRGSGLVYENQPGGMNEAYADMVGEVVEKYVFGSADMLIGWDLFVAQDQSLRYSDDPTKDGHSIKHVKDYKEGMSVHSSSGVYNHVFYRMSKVMGVRAAFESFVNANRLYWKPKTDFANGACGTLQGAYDAGLDMDVVANSFKAVGIRVQKPCKNISKYVTAELKSGTAQQKLHISTIRHPLFKVIVKKGLSKIKAVVTQGYHVAISTSYKRSSKPLASGEGSIEANVPSKRTTLYVRAFAPTGKEEIKNAMIEITLE